MRTVEVSLGDRSYPIYIGTGLLDKPDILRKHIPGKSCLVVTNTTVGPLYLDRVVSGLRSVDPELRWASLSRQRADFLCRIHIARAISLDVTRGDSEG